MQLLDVYETPGAVDVLWELLSERTPDQSISHKGMPTMQAHREFVASKPYLHWYLVDVDGVTRGAAYLSKQREIGIFIFKAHSGHQYGAKAVQLLMLAHPGQFLANISPKNTPSARVFHKLGFGLLQLTYIREAA